MPLQKTDAEDYTRSMIHAACAYLEELLKKLVHTWPWENIKSDFLPLGALVKRARKHLSPPLAQDLAWLSDRVYNFAKHHFSLENDDEKDQEHYFSLEEAIAVYLIVRKLGLELEKHFKRPLSELLAEY